jgi:Rps23 Pro-64 3,4-dihydroxylase Tpa1-like proline 4-hydroxylase
LSTTSKLYESKEELAPGIILYRGVWPESSEFLAQVKKDVQDGHTAWSQGKIIMGDEAVLNTGHRTVNVLNHRPGDAPVTKENVIRKKSYSHAIRSNIENVVEEYTAEYGIKILTRDTPQLMEYEEGCFFDWHLDDGPTVDRTVSFCYYMSSDYEGGEIEFKHFPVKHKPKAKELLIFPSNYIYIHRVNPVTRGLRYAVVSWWH